MMDRTRSPYWAGSDGRNDSDTTPSSSVAVPCLLASAKENVCSDEDLSGVEGVILLIRNEPMDSASSFAMNFVRIDWPEIFFWSSCRLTAWAALSLMALMMY